MSLKVKTTKQGWLYSFTDSKEEPTGMMFFPKKPLKPFKPKKTNKANKVKKLKSQE